MKHLENMVKSYLSKSTDYAIQICGEWGSGKTYYFKNTLLPIIEKNEVFGNAKKRYTIVYISLFGLKSIDDVSTKIVFDFYQTKYLKIKEKSKVLKVTKGILKIGLRGFLNLKKLGNINDYLTDIKDIGEDVLNTDELLICFDDLERKNKNLNIEELIGYINSLVDEGVKVLIISNENLLLKNEEEYKNLKEKTVGICVDFIPNRLLLFQEIKNKRYSSFPVFNVFLSKLEISQIKLLELIKDNYRHYIYSLDVLQEIYSKIQNEIVDIKDEISKKVFEELENIAYFTIAIAVEYKSSNIKYKDFELYKDDFLFMQQMAQIDIETKEPVLPKADNSLGVFIKKYNITESNYRFYSTIFNHITGYEEFTIKKFKTEFVKKFNLVKGEIDEKQLIYNKIFNRLSINLTELEYKEGLEKIIQIAESGFYKPTQYLSIVKIITDEKIKIKNINIEESIKKLKIGFKKSIATFYITERSDLENIEHFKSTNKQNIWESEFYDLFEYEFQEEKNKEKNKKSNEFAKLFLENYYLFFEKIKKEENFLYFLSYYSFFNSISSKDFISLVKKLENLEILELSNFIKKRYQSITSSAVLSSEKNKILELLLVVQKYKATLDDSIRVYAIETLEKSLTLNEQ